MISVVVGPARFNGGLDGPRLESGGPFRGVRPPAPAGLGAGWRRPGHVRHGRQARRAALLHAAAFARLSPTPGSIAAPERPELSQYTIRDRNRRLELSLMPRADQSDGLVALASIVSKTVRELWMDVFNAYWRRRVPGLRPTAGYPTGRRAVPAGDRAARPRRGARPGALVAHQVIWSQA